MSRFRPVVESFERRDCPALPFVFHLDLSALPYAAALAPTLDTAAAELAADINGRGVIDVTVGVNPNLPPNILAEGGAMSLVPIAGGVAETAAEAEALTGIDPLGPGAPECFMELSSSAVSAGIVEHEVFHGLGFIGLRGANGSLPAGVPPSIFDALTTTDATGAWVFTGAHAEAVFGGPVSLVNPPSGSAFYHWGSTEAGGGSLGTALMGPFGGLGHPLAIDLAALEDLGWSVNFPAPPPGPPPPVPPQPARPIGLQKQRVSPFEVRLDWFEPTPGVDGFLVQRALRVGAALGPWRHVGTVPGAIDTFADVIRPRLEYAYRVRAFSAGGLSAWSRIILVNRFRRPRVARALLPVVVAVP